MIDELIHLAKKHPGYREITDHGLRVMFETYRETTLIYCVDDEIKAFAIYQEWPDRLNFIAVVGSSDDRLENIRFLLKIRGFIAPDKMVCYFDESTMELKILCR